MELLEYGKEYLRRTFSRIKKKPPRKQKKNYLNYSWKRIHVPKIVEEYNEPWLFPHEQYVLNIEKAERLQAQRPFHSLQWHEKRIMNELKEFVRFPLPGMTIDLDAAAENLMEWKIQIEACQSTIYAGETFNLLLKFCDKYPFICPTVTFQGPNIPIHPQVYSNGRIRLSILNEDWNVALTAEYICLSISTMLRNCQEKRRPMDDFLF